MFDGLNNNRGEWKALADVHEAKTKALEDQKKKPEEGEGRRQRRRSHSSFIDVAKNHLTFLFFIYRRWKVKDMCHLLDKTIDTCEDSHLKGRPDHLSLYNIPEVQHKYAKIIIFLYLSLLPTDAGRCLNQHFI